MATTINASASAGLVTTADTSTILQLQTAGTAAVTVDASQNVGIGTASPTTNLTVVGTTGLNVKYGAGLGLLLSQGSSAGAVYINQQANDALILATNNTERMRIDSSGNLLVGTTDAGTASGVGLKLLASPTIPAFATVFNTASASQGAYLLYNTNATNNGFRFYVQANGGIVNYSANNINVSDERTKTDVQNAGNYLAKICAIPVRTFKYKDQDDDLLTLGVIAQEVESIAPELVNVDGFGETPEDGIPLKAIYQTDLQYALMKCIQEQQALITQLQADVAALKGATP